MPWDWQPKLKEIAESIGLDFFSTPFDPTAVDFLETINISAYKIASFEMVDLPLIRKVAQTGKPLIMSTGMASLSEIEEAVLTARSAGNDRIALLKCTSAYPAPAEEINLRTISHLSEAFDLPVGLSDHTLGIAVPVAAVAVGACIIEKHFTLTRTVPGPDSAFSLEPHEFKMMVEAVRTAGKAMGKVCYGITEREAARDIPPVVIRSERLAKGDALNEDNVRSIRQGYGLHTVIYHK